MTEFGRGVDEFEVDLFQSDTASVNKERFPESDDTFLRSHTASLNHDVVIVNLTVMGETTQRSNGLFRQVILGRGVVFDDL